MHIQTCEPEDRLIVSGREGVIYIIIFIDCRCMSHNSGINRFCVLKEINYKKMQSIFSLLNLT